MKQIVSTILGASLLVVSAASATETIVPLHELTEEMLQNFVTGNVDTLADIIEIQKDAVVPLNLLVTGDLLALDGTESTALQLRALKTFYVRCVEGEFGFSTDLAEWRPLSNFVTGACQILLLIEDKGPTAHIRLEVTENS